MNGIDFYDDGAKDLTADQRDALGQLHGRIAHDIAEAHLTGDKARADEMAGYRRMVSDGLSADPFVAADPAPLERDERDALEDRREELTRELHEAVASKDSYRAGRLDRERTELTEGLYGNGEIVGTGGRSL